MKKIKYFLFAIFAIALVGCTEDATDAGSEDPDSSSSDLELYFDDGLSTTFPVSDSDKTFEIPVTRSNGTSAATYEYDIDLDGGGYIVYNSAGEISFEAGETEAYITGYLSSSAPQGYSYEGAVSITNSDYAALFKTTTFAFTISFDYTWTLLVSEDGTDTTGLWIDGIFSTVFMDVPEAEKEVEIYEAAEVPGYYRIANVYDADFTATLMGVTSTEIASYVLLGDDAVSVDTVYTYINATDPDNVYFPYQGSGFWYDTTTYGGLYFASLCDLIFDLSSSSYPSTYGKMEDGVISFPKESIYVELTLYGAWINTESHYIFLPGVKSWSKLTSVTISDISVDDCTAKVVFEANELATYLKYAIVDYDATGESYETVAAGIKDGSIESSQVDVSQSFSTGTTISTDVQGTYALVAVPYGVDGDAGKFDASTCVAEFRISDNIATGVASGSYTVAEVVDDWYGTTYEDVGFELTRSAVTDYDYTSTDFFGFDSSSYNITYSWVLDPTAMKMYVTPTDCEGFEIDFYEPTYYAESYSTTYYYAYIGGGDDGYDPWEINIELNDAGDAYVMTTFATDARLGVFDTSTKTYISGYDAVIEAGTAIDEYVEASSAPATKKLLAPVNKSTASKTSSVTTAKEKATVRTEGVMAPLMK
ncbi:MAG: hypothetical protein SNG34_05300 [Rikenellaceae bacterium]